MDKCKNQRDLPHDKVTTGIQLAIAVLSLIGAGSTAVVMFMRRSVTRRETCIHFQLSLTDVLASIGIIASSIMYLSSCGENLCAHIFDAAKVFYLATFGLIVASALNVLRLLQRNASSHYAVLAANILAWMLPLPYIGLLVLDRNETATRSNCNCFPVMQHFQNGCSFTLAAYVRFTSLTFIAAGYVKSMSIKEQSPIEENRHCFWSTIYFLTAILFTFAALVITHRIIYKRVKARYFESVSPTNQQRFDIRRTVLRSILNCSTFAFCWLPYFIVEICPTLKSSCAACSSWLYTWTVLSFPSQGLLNSIVYGFSRTSFRNILRSNAYSNPHMFSPSARQSSHINYMTITDTEMESSCEVIR